MPNREQVLAGQFIHNTTSGLGSAVGAGINMGSVVFREIRTIVGTYDFSVQGGAIGSVNLKDVNGMDATLPRSGIILNSLIDVITAPTSGGAATIAFTAQSAGDIKAALAIASYTGLVAGVPTGSAATCIKLTADRTLTATIATAALTAGKINVIIQYILSE